ncbi:MAG: hypothetical protein RI556_00600 [Hydrogenovibrio sp.]|uniref:hypothetical protein n=1 Tax=Hydrogenovibrio sp. TaxID=2065821 RepID=UPI002870A26A|nr:hypothetical protein [Hydrogenovibrio sp.]MDR9497654.1 hypothetical protein [Hydrogenovibrio sp.]
MTQKEVEGIGALVLLGVIIYPFVWVYEQIGTVGIVVCGVGIIALFVYWHIHNEKQNQKAFEELILYTLHNRIPPDKARRINRKLVKENFLKSTLIRNLQIIRDSIEISLSSKKRETAESRAQLVAELHQEIMHEQAHLVSKDVLAEINAVCSQALTEFDTKLFINIANGHVEKANSLKTDKSKIKYLGLAIEALEEGISLGRGDLATLQSALADVKAKQAEYA